MAAPELPKQGDREGLERWLKTQPREVSLAIPSRAALRVLPLLSGLPQGEYQGFASRNSVLLPLFRGMMLPWVAAKFPTQGNELRSASAQAAADAADASGSARVAAASTQAAVASAQTAVASARAAASAFSAAYGAVARFAAYAAAAGFAASAVVSTDADTASTVARAFAPALAATQKDIEAVANEGGVESVLNAPLWQVRPPDSIRKNWDELKQQLLTANEGWDFWVTTYDAILEGATQSLNPAQLTFSVTLNGEEDWEKGKSDPAYVNRLILGWPETAKQQATSGKGPRAQRKSGGKVKAAPAAPVQPAFETRADFISDRPQADEDHLNRADMAFALAGRLNRFWDSNVEDCKKTGGEAAGFVMHIDAPWGGGKTSFANYLTRILNDASHYSDSRPEWMSRFRMDSDQWPEVYRRPWFIVPFNAWQHQDVSPPWWVLYDVIRRGILKQIKEPLAGSALMSLFEPYHRGKAWLQEMIWRLKTPDLIASLVVFLPPLMIAIALVFLGGVEKNSKGEVAFTGTSTQVLSLLVAVVLVLLPIFKSVVPAFMSSLLSGTPDAAKNYALGSGDPLDRFRKHFAKSMRRFERPILMVIDDLDRCKPDFVVDLIRGMQTIFKSERVIYLLLGDRDWITESFTVANDKMKAVEVGAEHEFGERFVEKAIQFSFVLPEPEPADRQNYVRRILNVGEKLPALSDSTVSDLQARIAKAEATPDFLERQKLLTGVRADAAKQKSAPPEIESAIRGATLRSGAADASAEKAVRHQLEGLSHVLPGNPRQVKRIFNTIGYIQDVAAYDFGGLEWQKMARWIVLMIEWPRTWFTLSRRPELIDEVFAIVRRSKAKARPQKGKAPKPDSKAAVAIAGNADVMNLIDFTPQKGDTHWKRSSLERSDIEKLVRRMPATSGKSFGE
ncbi:MAG: P-loop NTPase fold protein [Aestuariivirga sp.]